MRLASPYALLLLLFVPVLLYLCQQQRYSVAVRYSSIADLVALSPSLATRLRWVLPCLRTLALLLCILALARPQRGIEAIKISSEGIAILMVVDISGSMAALDLQVDGRQSSRLDAVKQTFRSFVGGGKNLSGREGDLIGMVTFARYPDSLCPLTLDHDTLLSLLDQVDIVSVPEEDGTAIGEGMALGVERLKDSTAKSRVMIVLTDGVNNAGETEPLQAAQIAKALGIKIYTIGAGTRGVAMTPVRSPSGQMVLQRTPVDIDERMLTEVATLTGGQYFRATDGATLQAIYAEIDRLEKTTNVTEHYQQYAELFPLLLMPALGCLVLEMVLVQHALPQDSVAGGRAHAFCRSGLCSPLMAAASAAGVVHLRFCPQTSGAGGVPGCRAHPTPGAHSEPRPSVVQSAVSHWGGRLSGAGADATAMGSGVARGAPPGTRPHDRAGRLAQHARGGRCPQPAGTRQK